MVELLLDQWKLILSLRVVGDFGKCISLNDNCIDSVLEINGRY